MPRVEPRIVLLARPGEAADRLRDAVAATGASCVLDVDPTQAGLSALVDAAPDVVLVVLDPAVEDVIERFEPVLGDARVDVLYEESDVVVRRDGWDLARWQRHLVAKLLRSGDVLPPVPAGEDEAPLSVAMPDAAHETVAEIADAFAHAPDDALESALADAVADASGHAFDTDAQAALDGDAARDVAPAGHHAFDPALAEYDDAPWASDAVAPFDPHADALVVEGVDGLGLEARALDGTSSTSAFDPTNAEDLSWTPPAGLGEGGELGFDVAPESALDATFDATFDATPVLSRDAATERSDAAEAAAQEPGAQGDGRPAMPALTLALDDGGTPAAVDADADTTRARFRHDLDALHARIAKLELVDDTPRRGPEQARGAVLVLSGIGGPDAVRQLLGALPADFPRPVLVQQKLDGGRYDRLVAQMQRASSMPVRLAEAGGQVAASTVYILPDAVGLALSDDALHFDARTGDLVAALPANDSAVLMFSGSEEAQVDAVMNTKWAGAFVGGQTPDGCYDASAPAALVARGGDAGSPAELAQRLVARWRQ